MLSPKRQKHRKTFRGTFKRIAVNGSTVAFGSFGLKSLEAGMVTDRQIESCRVVLARATRKIGKFWIRIFPDKPYTKKPPEVTMGAGKGDVDHFFAKIAPGRIMFEIEGLNQADAQTVLHSVSSKLPVTTKVISYRHHA